MNSYRQRHWKALSRVESLEPRGLMSIAPIVAGDNRFSFQPDGLHRSDLDGGNDALLSRNAPLDVTNIFVNGDHLYFNAGYKIGSIYCGTEPWTSNGTAAGTGLIGDLHGGAQSSNPQPFHRINGLVVFVADDNAQGNPQIFTSNGTVNGAKKLSPFQQHGWNGPARNVVFADDSVSWDYANSQTNTIDRMIGFGYSYAIVSSTLTTAAKGVYRLAMWDGSTIHSIVTAEAGGRIKISGYGPDRHVSTAGLSGIDLFDSANAWDRITVDPSVAVDMTFHSASGWDEFTGGSGTNTLVLGARQTADERPTYGASVTLTDTGGRAVFGNRDEVTLHGVFTRIIGTEAADDFHGTDRNETLIGGGGSDWLIGGGGDDSLDGGNDGDLLDGSAGNDTLVGGGGINHVFGREGDDRLVVARQDSVDGGTGDNTIIYTDDPLQPALPYTLRNRVLTIIGTAAADHVALGEDADNLTLKFNGQTFTIFRGVFSAIVVNAGAGNDVIDGRDLLEAFKVYSGAGNDWIAGGNGNDRFYGGDGDDQLYGLAGCDLLYGEAGNDRLFGGDSSDYLDGGDGTNVLRGEGRADRLFVRRGDNYRSNAGDLIAELR